MTDQDRIERLEQMVRTLAETVHSLTQVINTGSYEYSLSDLRHDLKDVQFYTSPPEQVHDHSLYMPASENSGIDKLTRILRANNIDQLRATQCEGAWHKDKSVSMNPWCPTCGRSIP